MNGRFVTFHGIDGTGKTTTAERFVEMADSVEMPLIHFDEINEQPLGLVDSREVAPFADGAQASIAKKLIQSDQLRRILSSGISIAKDRWAIDVYASHAFEREQLPDTVPTRILRPNLSVILLCEEQRRQERIAERGNPTEQDLIPNKPGTRAHFFEQYLLANIHRFSPHSLVVDTTDGDVEDTVAMVIERLENGDARSI